MRCAPSAVTPSPPPERAARRRPPRASAARALRRPRPASSSATHAEPSGSPTKPANRAVLRVNSHGCVTTGFQYAHGGPLGGQGGEGVRVMHARDRRPHPLVVRARLERQRSLPGRGDEVERLRRALQPQPLQPGGGEDDRVDLARVELAQARVDVAAQLHDLEVGPHGEQLRAPAQRGGADPRARGQPRQAGDPDSRQRSSDRRSCAAAGRRRHELAALAPARPARPSPSGPRGRSRLPPVPPRSCRPSATCRRRRAPGRRRW